MFIATLFMITKKGKYPKCSSTEELIKYSVLIPLEGMATHSSILSWRIPMDRGAWWGRGQVLNSMGSQRVGHN